MVVTNPKTINNEQKILVARWIQFFHSPGSLDSLSTKHNNIVYNIYILMLVIYHDLQSVIFSLSFLSKKLIIQTNVG
ncbi:hypothetical protein JHK87_034532 [Glycine soja]|nr:hypothetical protein JHK87_034532 [Glycine soja]